MTWLRATAVRVIKTGAEAVIGMVGTGAIGLLEADWANVASVAAMAMLVAFLTCIVGLPEVDENADGDHMRED